MILEPQNIKCYTVSTVSPSVSHEVMGPDAIEAHKDTHSSGWGGGGVAGVGRVKKWNEVPKGWKYPQAK